MIALHCPVCAAVLEPVDRSWRCAGGHSFDTAREGYINLLLAHRKKSLAPGDNADMVKARRDFLGAGYYAPLRDSALGLLRPLGAGSLLDIGCGEGYYTRAFAGVANEVLALDIAKPAIQIAAKTAPGMRWLVASAAALPVGEASVDVVSSLFSPLPFTEILRVLRPGGRLLLATPAPRHLWSLREALFDTVAPHTPEKFLDGLPAGLRPSLRLDLEFPLRLESQDALRRLLLMTPYYWRAKAARREALWQAEGLATDAAFSLLLLEKSPRE